MLLSKVALADEAVRIGPAPALESYLKGETILEAAKRSGAQARDRLLRVYLLVEGKTGFGVRQQGFRGDQNTAAKSDSNGDVLSTRFAEGED